jgi:hypothetical protein
MEENTPQESYIDKLAETASPFNGEYTFEDVEVPDDIAGKLKSDPRIKITNIEKGEFGLDMGTMVVSFKINSPITKSAIPEQPPEPLYPNGEGLLNALEEAGAHDDVIRYVCICREQNEFTGLLSSMHTFHQGGDGSIQKLKQLGTPKEVLLWKEGAEQALAKISNWDTTNKPILETIATTKND